MGWKCLKRPSTVLNHPEPCKANAEIEPTVWDWSMSWNVYLMSSNQSWVAHLPQPPEWESVEQRSFFNT